MRANYKSNLLFEVAVGSNEVPVIKKVQSNTEIGI